MLTPGPPFNSTHHRPPRPNCCTCDERTSSLAPSLAARESRPLFPSFQSNFSDVRRRADFRNTLGSSGKPSTRAAKHKTTAPCGTVHVPVHPRGWARGAVAVAISATNIEPLPPPLLAPEPRTLNRHHSNPFPRRGTTTNLTKHEYFVGSKNVRPEVAYIS